MFSVKTYKILLENNFKRKNKAGVAHSQSMPDPLRSYWPKRCYVSSQLVFVPKRTKSEKKLFLSKATKLHYNLDVGMNIHFYRSIYGKHNG